MTWLGSNVPGKKWKESSSLTFSNSGLAYESVLSLPFLVQGQNVGSRCRRRIGILL